MTGPALRPTFALVGCLNNSHLPKHHLLIKVFIFQNEPKNSPQTLDIQNYLLYSDKNHCYFLIYDLVMQLHYIEMTLQVLQQTILHLVHILFLCMKEKYLQSFKLVMKPSLYKDQQKRVLVVDLVLHHDQDYGRNLDNNHNPGIF